MSAASPAPIAHDTPAARWPGSHEMPRWQLGKLIDAPRQSWRNWIALLGPGLMTGGAAIGGGEWLLGPAVTARYGGALMWLATLSILGQVAYNLEISRYTLYTGEPIFTGKFRMLPGPRFWVFAYLLLDFGAIFPYLASNAAVPVAFAVLGKLPDAHPETVTWVTLNLFGRAHVLTQAFLIQAIAIAIFFLAMVPMIFGGKIYSALKAVMTFKIVSVFGYLLFIAVCFSTWSTWREIGAGFFKFGTVPVHGGNGTVDNVFLSLWRGDGLPHVDFSTIALLAGFAAIAGQGGLTNSTLSNYTRDQGWGMGYHVGAIPSVFGGRNLALSHVGMVFTPDAESLPRWRRWYRHVLRDQLMVWMPACFIGLALPSMLSVQFVPRGTQLDDWTVAGMTAGGVAAHIGEQWGTGAGNLFWYLTLLCGFVVLGTTYVSWVDGVVRRWVDVVWTSSARLRRWEPRRIRHLYFYVLSGYATFGLLMLCLGKPLTLLKIATNIMNFALGFSCLHVLAVNLVLLPRELRPNWLMRALLLAAGLFFIVLSIIVALHTADELWAAYVSSRDATSS